MKDEKLEAVAKEVFLSIPPDVRTGVFIDVFTPCDWHHAAHWLAYRLSELTQRHLVVERGRTWKLAE